MNGIKQIDIYVTVLISEKRANVDNDLNYRSL